MRTGQVVRMSQMWMGQSCLETSHEIYEQMGLGEAKRKRIYRLLVSQDPSRTTRKKSFRDEIFDPIPFSGHQGTKHGGSETTQSTHT